MTNPTIPDLVNKTTPVGADLFIISDSQDNNNEKNTSITQVITNNKLVATSGSITTGHVPALGASNTITDSGIVASALATVTGTPSSGHLMLSNGSTQIKDSGIAVDTSQNVTGVNTLNGVSPGSWLVNSNNLSDVSSVSTSRTNLGLGNAAVKGVSDNTKSNVASVSGSFTTGHILVAADTSGTVSDGGATSQFLVASNNLSDVANRTTSFDNIAPSSPSLGDMLYWNGTHWIKLSIGLTSDVLTVVAGIPSWTSSAATGFVDNAVFISNATTILTGGVSPTNINLGTLTASTTGNTWVLNGDGTGMKCQQAGTYSFSVTIPYTVSSASSFGVIFSKITKNNTPSGPISAINPITSSGNVIYQASLFHIITCSANDIIRITGTCGATIAPTVDVTAGISTGANVLITRLT